MARIGIAGAGVLGRLLAWQLARAGHEVSVVDPAPDPNPPGLAGQRPADGTWPAGFTAAGMLSPLAELDHADGAIAALGWRSIALWAEVAAALPAAPELLRCRGSLLLAHRSDLGSAQRVLARLQAAAGAEAAQALDAPALQALEPALAQGLHAWWLPGEGQVMPREMLQALARYAPGVRWHWGHRATDVQPGEIRLDDGRTLTCDLAIDVRGLGARSAGLNLRGVRGEILWLHAPGLPLQRPLRLLHPRHRIYLVPRPGDVVVVGASEIESEDRSPISLRTAVELMSAAHSVLPELAEARLLHHDTHLRPATPDHLPHVHHRSGLLQINGLFRHGWLIAPAMVQDALQRIGLAMRAQPEGATTP
jgi:glycine oxidase